MTSTSAPTFSQLWAEEAEELVRLAREVPADGIIVDIGTAQGGSAYLLHQASSGKGIRIHTYDPAPSAEAFEHLRHTTVSIWTQGAVSGAAGWVGRPVDLLFVDGSHHLADVVADYNAWSAHLAPAATVAFHDYDPAHRNGLIHLGAKVALDALLKSGTVNVLRRAGRILVVRAVQGAWPRVAAPACVDAVHDVAARVGHVRDRGFREATIDAPNEELRQLVSLCLNMQPVTVRSDGRLNGPMLVVGQPAAGGNPGSTSNERLDHLSLCYLLEERYAAIRSSLLAICKDRKALFKWEEALLTFEHSTGQPALLRDRLNALSGGMAVSAVSQFVAAEQIRILMWTRIVHAHTGYEL